MKILALLIGLAATIIMGSAYIHNPVESQAILAAKKTAVEIRLLQKAAGLYYRDLGSWPSNLTDLKTSGYLPASFPETNSWGNKYSLSVSGNDLDVSSSIPSSFHKVIENLLPNLAYTGDMVTSTTLPPGFETTFARYLHRYGDSTGRTMSDDLIMQGQCVKEVGIATDPSDGLPRIQGDSMFLLTAGDAIQGPLYAPRINAPVFFDTDNTDYYLSPAGGSRIRYLWVNDVYYPHLRKYASELAN